MRVYTSKGFQDIGGQQFQAPSTGGMGGSSGGMEGLLSQSGGGGGGNLNKIFAALMLSNPKQSSTYKTVYDLLKPEGKTAEQKNRDALFEPARATINKARGLDLNEAGSFKADTLLAKLNFPLGIGKKFVGKDEQNLVSTHQGFELLRQNVVRAMQGARMSDRDIEIAANYIPNVQDSPPTIKTKLDNLEYFLNSIQGLNVNVDELGGGMTSGGGDWE